MSRMKRHATTKRDAQHPGAQQVRHAQVGELGDEAAGDRADQHRAAAERPALGRRRCSEAAREAGRVQRVDQPRLGRAGEEGEAQAQQDRGDRPAPAAARGSATSRDTAASSRAASPAPSRNEKPPAAHVGDDAGRHLEDDLPEGEERVGRERLGVVQPRVEQEQRVDAPDEGRRKRRQERQRQVGALDRLDRVRDRSAHAGGLRTSEEPSVPEGCSTGSARPRRPPSRNGRSRRDARSRAASARLGRACCARARSPRPCARPARRRHRGGSPARAGRRRTSTSERKTAGSRDLTTSPSTVDERAGDPAGTPPRARGPQSRPAEPPVARSNSSSPSSTLMLVSNDPRIEPFSCSQFQPPSAICSPRSRSTTALDVLAEVRADRDDAAVDARLDLALEEAHRPVVVPARIAHAGDRCSHLVAGRIDTEVVEQLQREEGRGEQRRERAAAPQPGRGSCSAKQPRAPALGRDPRPFGRDRRRPARRSGRASPASGWQGRSRAANRSFLGPRSCSSHCDLSFQNGSGPGDRLAIFSFLTTTYTPRS